MESLLLAHDVPTLFWTKILSTRFRGADSEWFSSNVLVPDLSWDEAKQLLHSEFVGLSAHIAARKKLRSLRQGAETAAQFFRQIEFYAKEAQQPLDADFAYDLLEALRPAVAQQTKLLLGADVYRAL